MKLSDEILLHLRACRSLVEQAKDLWRKALKLEKEQLLSKESVEEKSKGEEKIYVYGAEKRAKVLLSKIKTKEPFIVYHRGRYFKMIFAKEVDKLSG